MSGPFHGVNPECTALAVAVVPDDRSTTSSCNEGWGATGPALGQEQAEAAGHAGSARVSHTDIGAVVVRLGGRLQGRQRLVRRESLRPGTPLDGQEH